nr:immunoglobulin light chain junction region [Macaca mulatta]MOV62571.1 immunoglobulin light chain junction region [Macaca mulatta]MOV64634.1 immunoglobulin light chain junction region [Macaca mulatta]
CQQHNTYPNSF